MIVFQRKNGHISETVRDTATVTIKLIINRKWRIGFQMT